MHPSANDIGAYVTTAIALAPASAAGSAINGVAYDRFAHRPLNLSVKTAFGFSATLASGATTTVGYHLEDSANGSDWDRFDTASGVSVISAADGAVVNPRVEFSANIVGARQYIRAVVTPTLSSGAANVFGMFVFGGGELIPADGSEG